MHIKQYWAHIYDILQLEMLCYELMDILDEKNVINEGFTFFCCKIENHLAAILDLENFRKYTEINIYI